MRRTWRAVVLARGLGTRMREADPAVTLTVEQQRSADAGVKPMMPIHGRPFIDYVLSAIADAGVSDVALVVAPDHEVIRRYFAEHAPSRLSIAFVVQDAPLGTANAVLAAERWAGEDPFLAMNADNLYPVPPLRDLASLDEPGLLAFDADDLVRTSNIPPDRVKAFAIVETDNEGYLTRVIEKPADLPPEGGPYGSRMAAHRASNDSVASAFRRKDLLVSMNCWRFDIRIFDVCRDVPRSARGEFELPEAVALAIGRGVRFKAVPALGPVLDLSRRADLADVARRLETAFPRP